MRKVMQRQHQASWQQRLRATRLMLKGIGLVLLQIRVILISFIFNGLVLVVVVEVLQTGI